jgi:prepilin-type processing-associated H-X9-DG protein
MIRHANRKGVTQLELLVAVSIIGLLSALGLTAVQQARRTAVRLDCSNRLKELGLLSQSWVATHGEFPNATIFYITTVELPEVGPALTGETLSPYGQLLLQLGVSSREATRWPEFNASFRCPADPWSAEGNRANDSNRGSPPNYVFNFGSTSRYRDEADKNGFFRYQQRLTPADITDGQSNTVAMSERLCLKPPLTADLSEVSYHPGRHLWWTNRRGIPGEGSEQLVIEICQTGRTSPHPISSFAAYFNGYDHLLGPNQPGCFNGPVQYDNPGSISVLPPSSEHPGGVNLLFIDGHVTYIQNSIDLQVWRALGTINGHETLSIEF